MYEQSDLEKEQKAISRLMLLMLLPAAILLGGVVWSFVVRIKWLTILLSILTGSWIVFIFQNCIAPRRAYAGHIENALHHADKCTEGVYLRTEQTPVERNDVMYYAFYMNVGEKMEPEDDRLLYLDALRPLPDWRTGDRLRVRHYDKFVAGYEVLARGDAGKEDR